MFFTTSRTEPHLVPCPPPSSLSPHHLLPKKRAFLIGIRCSMLCGTIFASIMCVALHLSYISSHLALIQNHKKQTLLFSLALAAHIFTPFGPSGESPFLNSTRSPITKGLHPSQLPRSSKSNPWVLPNITIARCTLSTLSVSPPPPISAKR